jgi:hypothetical protein
MPQNAPRDERWLLRRIDELEKRVKSLETAPRAGNASVTTGAFVIKDPATGADLLRTGYLGQLDDIDAYGTSMSRPTGELMFQTYRGDGGDIGGFWIWYDKNANPVVSDDSTSGVGLARPYIGSAQFSPLDTSLWPSTTSSSFGVMWQGHWVKQHPWVDVRFASVTDSSTTGEVKVIANGASTTVSVPANDDTVRSAQFAIPGVHMQQMLIQISVRRTGGSGAVLVYPYSVFGIQSP